MIFSSLTFLIFFAIYFPLSLLLRRHERSYLLLLFVASCIFYMSWSPWFITLILFSTALDYFAGLGMARYRNKKKTFLWMSLCGNLGLLAVFKYSNFAIDSVNTAWHSLTGSSPIMPHVDILLPVGISFYTFQTLSYTIDVYRGAIEPETDPLRFGAFVTFFPQLVAGPILRAADFLPQLRIDPAALRLRILPGLKIFVLGLAKKLLIADSIAPYSDNVFLHTSAVTGYEAIIGVLAYTIQIYCDFSGYSDMAIGLGMMMGYDILENFRMPYLATNITEFWRRWHMSLSSWLRDYLYISLGGNRKGETRTRVNLMLTMLIGGLWHGASWSFVFWGGMHGLFLVLHKAWIEVRSKFGLRHVTIPVAGTIVSWVLTQSAVMFLWVFFRAGSFEGAIAVLSRILTFEITQVYYMPTFFLGLLLVVVGHAYGHLVERTRLASFKYHSTIETTGYAVLVLLLITVAPTHTSPFVYFQF